jgi:uncharacterized membrane protein YozB (DUF420 family)
MVFGLGLATIAALNLAVQTTAYVILIFGFLQARKKAFDTHRKVMMAAVSLLALSLILVMGPSFYSIITNLPLPRIGLAPTVTIIHSIFGTTALSMAVVALVKTCYWVGTKVTLRKYMITMFSAWTTAYTIGIIVYLMFYTSAFSAFI